MTPAHTIRTARVYDTPTPSDGARLLVDRLWPRGVSKSDLRCDAWLRGIGPSTELRKWFGHDPKKWPDFRRRYFKELDANTVEVEACLERCARGPVTLLYAAADRDHNNAVVLCDYLRRRLEETGPRT